MFAIYETPTLEVVEIEVEKGFAASVTGNDTEQMDWKEGSPWD